MSYAAFLLRLQHVSVRMCYRKESVCPGLRNLVLCMQMHSRRAALDVHEFDGRFRGAPAHFKVTSVIGHVLSIDFPAKYQSWETTEPSSLFDAPTIKSESNPKVRTIECTNLMRNDLWNAAECTTGTLAASGASSAMNTRTCSNGLGPAIHYGGSRTGFMVAPCSFLPVQTKMGWT